MPSPGRARGADLGAAQSGRYRRFRVPSPAERAAVRHSLGIDPETVLHLLVGGLTRRKNHEVGIAAIEQLPSRHRLIMVGPVLPDERSYAEALAARVAASPAVARLSLIAGFVPDVERLMYAADCLWMPSLEEGLGNVMLEALCCGVPCIINERLGLNDHIRDGEDGRAAAPSPPAWANAAISLGGLIGNVAARQQMAERAQTAYAYPAIDAELWRRLVQVVAGGRRLARR